MSNVFKATIGDKSFDIRLELPGAAEIDGHTLSYDLRLIESGSYSLVLDGRVYAVQSLDGLNGRAGFVQPALRPDARGREVQLSIQGKEYVVAVDDARSLLMRSYLSKRQASSAAVTIRAPMPGLIVRVEVRSGQEIQAGAGLVVLEAMKMENEIKALAPSKVAAVYVSAGKAVEKGEPLVALVKG
jgi:pyruvate carboxylase subunit B